MLRRTKPNDERLPTLIDNGLAWLRDHQNADGGWGDTTLSVSNISTSMLVRAVFAMCKVDGESLAKLEAYLDEHCGRMPAERAEAIRARYGKDRTFAVPILTTCALAGLVEWKEVVPLPFEIACFPQSWFRFLGMPVVSYALPALIAIGQAIHHHAPSWNPLVRLIRRAAIPKTLRVLESIQPSSGGYLEAIPLTSFVTLSLASIGLADHPVAKNGLRFIVDSVRADGSWPIDTNLATWVTTLSINALVQADDLESLDRQPEIAGWIVGQQFRQRHPYTGADPGGFGWSDLPGALPDADDTPGAVLALCELAARELPLHAPPFEGRGRGGKSAETVWRRLAHDWILGLQNRDGGWPTFCRGFGSLPFDRSGADITAHNIRALAVLGRDCSESDAIRSNAAIRRGLDYLAKVQRPDGAWVPLWFGNQFAANDENPTYGTTKALAVYRDLLMLDADPARRGFAWLLGAQNADGGWGGDRSVASSIEETALAVEILLCQDDEKSRDSVDAGLGWLIDAVESGGLAHATPIGFYFAKLWYFEKLYPIIFSVAALGAAYRKFDVSHRRSPRLPQSLLRE